MFVIKTVDDLWDHIAYVLAYAPDRFPHEDFLAAERQMNLLRAFELLRQGVDIAYPESKFARKRHDLNRLLDLSHRAYLAGNEIEGGQLLNTFEGSVFENNQDSADKGNS